MNVRQLMLQLIKNSTDPDLDKELDYFLTSSDTTSNLQLPNPIEIIDAPTNNKQLNPNFGDNFPEASKLVGNAEGGWNLNKNDKGGETIFGISRNNHPDWSGWIIVDEAADKYGRGSKEFIKYVNNNKELKTSGHNFYYMTYWLPCNADKLPREVGIIMYDMEINSGLHVGRKTLQKALVSLGYNIGKAGADGIIGANTIAAVIDANESNKVNLLETFLKFRYNFYHSIVVSKPSQSEFWEGWVNRLRNLGKNLLGYEPAFLQY